MAAAISHFVYSARVCEMVGALDVGSCYKMYALDAGLCYMVYALDVGLYDMVLCRWAEACALHPRRRLLSCQLHLADAICHSPSPCRVHSMVTTHSTSAVLLMPSLLLLP